jgi:predicted phage-related endonuclease
MASINEVIKELKEYEAIQEQLKKEVELLKAQAIKYLEENGIDEVATTEGKVTYREVISNRFDTTSFKKDFMDVYEEYVRQTTSMRFTIN